VCSFKNILIPSSKKDEFPLFSCRESELSFLTRVGLGIHTHSHSGFKIHLCWNIGTATVYYKRCVERFTYEYKFFYQLLGQLNRFGLVGICNCVLGITGVYFENHGKPCICMGTKSWKRIMLSRSYADWPDERRHIYQCPVSSPEIGILH
jgi:hypothetical protein